MGKPLPLVPPISIHALREEGDLTTDTELRQTVISIHALREEGDRRSHRRGVVDQQISIHALREEGDIRTQNWDVDNIISIHALREEGDKPAHNIRRHSDKHFYPRPPRGGRQGDFSMYQKIKAFLSTPSARRATSRWPSG